MPCPPLDWQRTENMCERLLTAMEQRTQIQVHIKWGKEVDLVGIMVSGSRHPIKRGLGRRFDHSVLDIRNF